jgi:DNA primase
LCFNDGCDSRGSLVQLLYSLGLTRKQVDRVLEGIDLPSPAAAKIRRRAELTRGWDLLPEFILGAYEHCPTKLVDAGFDEELLRRFDVGYDETNDRITFAVRDLLGRLAAISGRAYDDWVVPRYKVYDASPATKYSPPGELYGVLETDYTPDNRRHLYGFHDIYPARYFRREESQSPVILTEGYKSTLWMHQQGFDQTVGLQGSSLTMAQTRLLGKIRGPFLVLMDNEPGKAFPDRKRRCSAIRIALQLRRSGLVRLCTYPEEKPPGTSPDDLTKDELEAVLKDAKTLGQIALMR